MSDASPEQYEEYVTQDGPGSADASAVPPGREHPDHDAHGGSMAPGLVDDDGTQVREAPPAPPS